MRRFGRYNLLSELRFIFQNLIYHLLQEKGLYGWSTIHFWRTKDRAEVDFIINSGEDVIPVEVKCRELKDKTIARSLRNFINRYKPKEAWVVNIGLKHEEEVKGTMVKFMPFFELF